MNQDNNQDNNQNNSTKNSTDINHYTFDEIEIGQKENFQVTITEAMQKQFCELSGDVNPMHLTDEYAKEFGYEHKLVYGMLTASLYSRLVGVHLPGEYCLFQQCDTTFNAPVYVGDELTVEGEVVEKHDVFRRIKVKAYVKNQKGKKVSRATLMVGVSK